MNDFIQRAGEIPYQFIHPHFMYALVKWLRPQVVVEVDTHIGMTAVWLARGLQENGTGGKLFCIDPFAFPPEEDQENRWNRHIDSCGVRDAVTLIKGKSQEAAWPDKVDMTYVDGNHSSKACRYDALKAKELGSWCVILKSGTYHKGVATVVQEVREQWGKEWEFLEVYFDLGLLIALKRTEKPLPKHEDFEEWEGLKPVEKPVVEVLREPDGGMRGLRIVSTHSGYRNNLVNR